MSITLAFVLTFVLGGVGGCGALDTLRSVYCEPSNEAPEAVKACGEAVLQLGLTYSINATQRFVLSIEECAPGVGGEAKSTSPRTIHLCREALRQGTERWVTKHEIGHLIGLDYHLDCATGAVMSPKWSCAKRLDPDYAYTDLDVSAIKHAAGLD